MSTKFRGYTISELSKTVFAVAMPNGSRNFKRFTDALNYIERLFQMSLAFDR